MAGPALDPAHGAVQLDDLLGAGAGLLVQLVDVLGDHGHQPAAPLEIGERQVAGVGPGCPRRRADPVAPGLATDVGIGQVVLQGGRLLRPGVLGPHPLRAPEVRDAGIGGDPRSGQGDDAVRPGDERQGLGELRGHQATASRRPP